MKLVLDTNIVLDLFLFGDPAVQSLHDALIGRAVQWFATPAMRDELACVLAYPHLQARMQQAAITHEKVLASFDEHVEIVEVAPPAKIICRDTDDQKFIDLAITRRATLLSKDKHVLALRRKLAAIDVTVARAL